MAALALGILIFTVMARATGPVAKSNPYSVIFQHNVFGLVPPQASADARAAVAPPSDITLNGIMNIFGSKYALFKVKADKDKSYFLGEGQSDGEIELLSVDDGSGTIKVKNHGIVQIIALEKPPALVNAPPAATPSIAPTTTAADNNGGQVPAEGIPSSATDSNPAGGGAPLPPGLVAFGGGNSSGNSTPANSTSGGGSSSTPSTPAAAPEPWWVIPARNVEAARIAMASLVSAGEDPPFPLTPLTPPGTPANLIGPDRLYFIPQSN